MIVRLFQPRFWPLIRSGEKRQTIRLTPKRMPKVGEVFSARGWGGQPYRSKQILLHEGVVTQVRQIEFYEPTALIVGGVTFSYPPGLDHFANQDGFNNWREMIDWFQANHGVPNRDAAFVGILTEWK